MIHSGRYVVGYEYLISHTPSHLPINSSARRSPGILSYSTLLLLLLLLLFLLLFFNRHHLSIVYFRPCSSTTSSTTGMLTLVLLKNLPLKSNYVIPMLPS